MIALLGSTRESDDGMRDDRFLLPYILFCSFYLSYILFYSFYSSEVPVRGESERQARRVAKCVVEWAGL